MQNPGTVATLEARAIDLARRGEFGTDARNLNEEITRLSPSSQGAWTRLARCCLELGQLDAAAAALDAALNLNPQNTIARNLQIEVTRRRAGPVEPTAPRKRTSTGGRTRAASGAGVWARPRRGGTLPVAGIGRAEFTTLAHLPPDVAAEALSGRLDPLLMALNERPFAAKVVEARNRAAQAGARLFRRGSAQPVSPGHIQVFQQGGRWEPQLHLALFAAAHSSRDCLGAGLAFDLRPGAGDDRSDAGRERALAYFEVFQQQVASTWRVHLTDWLRANGGSIQLGDEPPSTDRLPADVISELVDDRNPARHGRIFCGRWLCADRPEDVAILTDGPRLVRWIEQVFNDLLPLWATVYRAIR